MKTYPKQFLALVLVAFSAFSCTRNQVAPSTNITFSNSPFDVQSVNAKFAKDIAYDNKERTQFAIESPQIV
jgi:hypothetical protein